MPAVFALPEPKPSARFFFAPQGASYRRMGQYRPVLGHESGAFRQEHIRTPHQRRLAGYLRRRGADGIMVGLFREYIQICSPRCRHAYMHILYIVRLVVWGGRLARGGGRFWRVWLSNQGGIDLHSSTVTKIYTRNSNVNRGVTYGACCSMIVLFFCAHA